MMVQIQTFAILKDYFDVNFELEIQEGATVADVLEALQMLNPQATAVLRTCKVVVGDAFVPLEMHLPSGASILLLPPSSGG